MKKNLGGMFRTWPTLAESILLAHAAKRACSRKVLKVCSQACVGLVMSSGAPCTPTYFHFDSFVVASLASVQTDKICVQEGWTCFGLEMRFIL